MEYLVFSSLQTFQNTNNLPGGKEIKFTALLKQNT